MEYWKAQAKRPPMECLVPTILSLCMLVISIICLICASVYYAKLFGSFPLFNNVIIKTGLVQVPLTPTISNLNQSNFIRRTQVSATVPSIFVNQSYIGNLTADFIPSQQIPVTYPFLTSVTVNGLIGDNLTVQNATGAIVNIDNTFSATNVSNLNAGDIQPNNINITTLNTTTARVHQGTTAQTLTVSGMATIVGTSTIGTQNNSVTVIADNLTSSNFTNVGGSVSTNISLEIADSLTLRGTSMEVQSGTVALTRTSSIVAADDNTINFPLGLQTATMSLEEQNITLTGALNVQGQAAFKNSQVTTLTSISLEAQNLTSQTNLTAQTSADITTLTATTINNTGAFNSASISTKNNNIILSSTQQTIKTPTVSFRDGMTTFQVSPAISQTSTGGAINTIMLNAAQNTLTLGPAGSQFSTQTATFQGGVSFTNGLNGTSLTATSTSTSSVIVSGTSTITGTFTTQTMSAASAMASVFATAATGGGIWYNDTKAVMTAGANGAGFTSACGTAFTGANQSTCFVTSQSNQCPQNFVVP